MSQRLLAGKTVKVQGDQITFDGPVDGLEFTDLTLNTLDVNTTLTYPGTTPYVLSDSKAVVSPTLHDVFGVIPDGKLMLKLYKMNDLVFYEFGQIDVTTYFTVVNTNDPTWDNGTIPVGYRPLTNRISIPVIVHEDAGAHEAFELVIIPSGFMAINHGNSTLFTSGKKLYIARSSGFYTM